MAHQYRQDPQTGLVRQPLSTVIVGGVFFFVILVLVAAILPYFSIYYMYISMLIGLLGFGSLVWINIQPNLYARFFLNIGISSLCAIIAFRAFDNLLPEFSFWGGLLILIITILAHTLPIWNLPTAKFIREELSAPKTSLGKAIFRVSLLLVPIVGVLGASLELVLHREDKSKALSFILLSLFGFLAIAMPFAYRYPSSPWEHKPK